MYMNNLLTNVLTLGGSGSSSHPETRVKYTQSSGLADWSDEIVGELNQNSIPNRKQAEIVDIGTSVTSIRRNTFNGCNNLTNVTIPNSVTSIGNEAFSYCTSITSVTIPESITTIGNLVFWGCDCLVSITIPNIVTSIGAGAFQSCIQLKNLTIPDRVTNIETSLVRYCDNLTSITIGCGVTNINQQAFLSCISCTIFDFRKSTSIPTLQNVNAFQNTPSNKEIIVPDSLYDSWKATNNWNSSTNNIVNCIVKASQSSLGSL